MEPIKKENIYFMFKKENYEKIKNEFKNKKHNFIKEEFNKAYLLMKEELKKKYQILYQNKKKEYEKKYNSFIHKQLVNKNKIKKNKSTLKKINK